MEDQNEGAGSAETTQENTGEGAGSAETGDPTLSEEEKEALRKELEAAQEKIQSDQDIVHQDETALASIKEEISDDPTVHRSFGR